MSRFPLATVLLSALMITLSACQSAPQETEPESTDSASSGPHADLQRELAAPEVRSTDTGVQVAHLDLGNVTAEDFAAPVRGVVTLPKAEAKGLVLINHLRAPNCGEEFAYPCDGGSEETRMDFGMEYLAVALSEAGYATITPDLGPLWIGGEVTTPYNQQDMWQDTITMFFDQLETGVEGIQIPAKLREHTGVVVHSRAGALIDPAVELLGQEHLMGVFAYAPSYDTFEYGDYSPAPIDVPYFAMASLEDRDVGPSANQWLSIYLDQQRNTPAEVALIPGLGHMPVNTQLEQQGMDDRIGCEELDCPDAKAHQELLAGTIPAWFTHLQDGSQWQPTGLLAGDNVRWLRITPQPATQITPRNMQAQRADGTSQPACWIADPMDPAPIMPEGLETCPWNENGVVHVIGEVALGNAFTIEVPASTTATHLAAHMAPFGSGQQLAPVITVHYADGSQTRHEVPADAPGVRDQMTEESNGEYVLSTISVDLPTQQPITKVEIQGGASHKGELVLAGVDLY